MDGFRHGHGRATISPRNTAAAAQFDEGMQCIPQVGRTTHVGGTCGDGLRNQQADVARGPEVPWWAHNGQDDGWDNDDDVGTVGTLTTTEAGEISEDDDDEDEDCVPFYEDEADIAREDATHEASCMQQHFEKNRQKHGDGEPEMGAVDDAEDDDAPHFHFLKKAGIEAADSGKTRAVLAECWRALSFLMAGNNKKKPRTIEFIHHNTSTKGTLLEHNREEDGMTDDDIKELCKACSNLLHTLDATHSRFLKWYMKWDDEAKKAVRELEALIASALKQARAIGNSMTPKWHLLEDHILDQHTFG